jgi:hypothetical protein
MGHGSCRESGLPVESLLAHDTTVMATKCGVGHHCRILAAHLKGNESLGQKSKAPHMHGNYALPCLVPEVRVREKTGKLLEII